MRHDRITVCDADQERMRNDRAGQRGQRRSYLLRSGSEGAALRQTVAPAVLAARAAETLMASGISFWRISARAPCQRPGSVKAVGSTRRFAPDTITAP